MPDMANLLHPPPPPPPPPSPPPPQSTLPPPKSTLPPPQSKIPPPKSTIPPPHSTLPPSDLTLSISQSTFAPPQSTLPPPHSELPSPQSTLPQPRSTLLSPQSTLPPSQSAIAPPQSTLPPPQSTLYPLQSTLALPHTPAQMSDDSALNLLVKAAENGQSKWDNNKNGVIKSLKQSCSNGGIGKRLEEHVEDWVKRRIQAGVPKNKCFFPFLTKAPKLVDCYHCGRVIYPGDKLKCAVHGCEVVFHLKCGHKIIGSTSLKEFKCPQHACYLCGKKNYLWRCIKCHMAMHDKCTAFPEHVSHLLDQPGRIICWRHPTDFQPVKLQRKTLHQSLCEQACMSLINLHSDRCILFDQQHALTANSIEDLFDQLPIPSVGEEFKIDINWKDSVETTSEPPPYFYTKRNIYLIKKKRESIGADTGCTSCRGSKCTDGCVCRVQSISCSKACRCSDKCTNRPFRKEKNIKIVQTEFCGWGVVAAELIHRGDFIIEYVGEVIDDALCEKRFWDMKYKGVSNFYMCEIRKDFTIDATFKGNFSRFLNHSCDPNCKLEKWDVEGEIRVGVFAARSIEVGEALTYDYRFVQFGDEVKCHCGASNCQGYIGTKKKTTVMEFQWGLKRKRTSTTFSDIIKS
ncbi:hypothetical protein LIER_16218 [Lithospermum erythrorhizon]|uniref:Uncharacterized protein n=1 Tax=Lithospermum erythrorhizon TaxID=34254 RepID=A0AAV3Q8B2_LITER